MKKLLLVVGMMMFVGGGVSPVFGEADTYCTLECAENGGVTINACTGQCEYSYSGTCLTIWCSGGGSATCCDFMDPTD